MHVALASVTALSTCGSGGLGNIGDGVCGDDTGDGVCGGAGSAIAVTGDVFALT